MKVAFGVEFTKSLYFIRILSLALCQDLANPTTSKEYIFCFRLLTFLIRLVIQIVLGLIISSSSSLKPKIILRKY